MGGGDRCVGGAGEIGFDVNGKQILSLLPPEIIPIKLNSSLEPEEQIAAFVKEKSDCGIPPENIFYDSFGKGALAGFAFAKLFGSNCPVPVDAGGKPSARPVRFDLYVHENGKKRLQRCDEYYSKKVSELWFCTREAVHSEQIRNLDKETAYEGQLRLFKIVPGNRIEVESKDDMKERVKKSPDLYDWFSILVEGARQRGFKITRIGAQVDTPETDRFKWFRERQEQSARKRAESSLHYS